MVFRTFLGALLPTHTEVARVFLLQNILIEMQSVHLFIHEKSQVLDQSE